MSLVYPTENGSILLYPTSRAMVPFLCVDHCVSHAGFDLLWGLDQQPWVLISEIKHSRPGSVLKHFPEIARSLCQLFMPHADPGEARWFCWYQTLSHGFAFDEILEAGYQRDARCFDIPCVTVERAVYEHLLSNPTWMKAA